MFVPSTSITDAHLTPPDDGQLGSICHHALLDGKWGVPQHAFNGMACDLHGIVAHALIGLIKQNEEIDIQLMCRSHC